MREELNALRNETEIMKKKLAELADDELRLIVGGTYSEDKMKELENLLNYRQKFTEKR